MSEMATCLQPTEKIDSNHPAVIEKVLSLTENMKDEVERAVALFYFVRDEISYNMYACKPGASNQASAILQNGEGWCLQKGILLAAMGRAAGIPSRLVLATIRNHKAPSEVAELMGTDLFFPHTYNQFYLKGKWIKAAATFDSELCRRIEVPVVEFDGNNDAVLPSRSFDGSPYIEYIEHFGHFADLPWLFIQDKCRQIYGPEFAGYITGS